MKFEWIPEYMRVRYDNWIKGLKWDWCISRQISYGIPFPVWYCKSCGEIKLASVKDLPVDPISDKPRSKCKCGCDDWIPEEGVINTWATSSLTPKLAIELVDKKLWDKLYPMSLRPNAHDIITFWLFNTVVKSYLHDKVAPWKTAIISGHIQDPHGKKMSKSKGNVIAPEEVIKKYSADALRFLVTGVALGDDYPYKEQEVVRGTKFVIKLWNAARFLEMHKLEGNKEEISVSDEWILNSLTEVIRKATDYMEDYEYSKAKRVIVDFFWNEFADYYLEMIKYRLYGGKKASKNAAIKTFSKVFLDVLKMSGLFTPFVTEEIYRELYNSKESLHNQSWPIAEKTSKSIEALGNFMKIIISEGRQYKINNKMSLGAELDEVFIEGPSALKKIQEVIKGTLRIKKLIIKDAKELKIIIK